MSGKVREFDHDWRLATLYRNDKILSGKYDTDVVPLLNNACTFRTRDNKR